jgi:helicase
VRYGVTEKLLPLVRLQGIGRVRAKVLYNSGFKSASILKAAPLARLVEIPLIGPSLAKTIKEQIGGVVDQDEWRRLDTDTSEQRSITDFFEKPRDKPKSDR